MSHGHSNKHCVGMGVEDVLYTSPIPRHLLSDDPIQPRTFNVRFQQISPPTPSPQYLISSTHPLLPFEIFTAHPDNIFNRTTLTSFMLCLLRQAHIL